VNEFYAWLLTEKAQVIVSGGLGGIVRWLTLREKMSDGFVSVVVGAICALYLGPLVQPILAPFIQVVLTEAVSRASFTAFIVGLGGITFSGFVIDMVKAKRGEVRRSERMARKPSPHEVQPLPPTVLHHLGRELRAYYGNIHAVEPESHEPDDEVPR
jgi:fluoride ion exporter CrcB/FEX